jgi:ankyrin repeat protein
MLACKRGHERVVEVLVSRGAEIYMRDCRARTARDTAIRRHHLKLLKYLNTQVATTTTLPAIYSLLFVTFYSLDQFLF